MFRLTFQRLIARLLIVSLAWSQSTTLWAAVTLADAPLAVSATVAPNVMLTLDDSGSMMFEVMPEEEIMDASRYMFPRAAGVYGELDYTNNVVEFDATNRYARRLRSAVFNRVYYDPDIRYQPWSNSDGSLMANADPAAAYHNPRIPAAGTRNLTVDATETAQWLQDDGTVSGSQAKTFYPATHFKYDGSGDPWAAGSYQLVEIKLANAPFAKGSARTDCSGATCSYAEEMQNFANWYQYARSRVLASRSAIGRAFAAQGGALRVGFGAINKGNTSVDGVNTTTIIKGVRPFSGADRTAWFDALYDQIIPARGTPLRQALDDVGKYFERTDNKGPWGEFPGVGGGTQSACRQSYNILMTDGYWNGNSAGNTSAKLNQDGLAGSTITGPGSASYTYTPANPFSDAFDQTLADVAMYYWKRDLRTDLSNTVPTNGNDPAFWQHLVNFTIGLGVYGTIPKADIDAAFTSTPTPINWPQPNDTVIRTKIDDLAHAAINSRGGFFSASDPDGFAEILANTLVTIVGRSGAGSALGVADPNITATNNRAYASSFDSSNWTGDLVAYTIDAATGAVDAATPVWSQSAQTQLDAVAPGARKIASYSGSAGIQFQPTTATTTTKLSVAQRDLLRTPMKWDGDAVVAYLRGERSGETAGTYRVRSHLLGDSFNAEPLAVGGPRARYADSGYSAFRSAHATRPVTVYLGANDGMLHAFDGASGAERWAYVPTFVLPTLNVRTQRNTFVHLNYVDATPVVADVDFNNTSAASGAPDWRSILVGGLGKGGRGFYAIDVTDPVPASEAALAGKVLWEFPNAATSTTVSDNMGYSYGKPVIAKTATMGWVVLVTSGYNNDSKTASTGYGYLHVLDARTGTPIASLSTGTGTKSNPSGLAQISAYAENADVDNTVDFVYGGDLYGNVWRFDLRGAAAGWNVKKIAALVDGSGDAQPVTAAPELSKVNINGADKRLIHVGTGQYLGAKDIPGASGAYASASSTQTFYTLLDNMSTTPTISPLRSNLVQQVVSSAGVYTIQQVDYSAGKKGWYLDLPLSGERVVSEAAVAGTGIAFTSILPGSDPCKPGGASYYYRLDFASEQGRNGGVYVTPLRVPLGNMLASRPVLVKVGNDIKAIIRTDDGSSVVQDLVSTSAGTVTRRISWRELPER